LSKKTKITSFSMTIYNRWGGTVFIADQIEDYWDGTFNGKDMDSGVFVFIIEYSDGIRDYQESGDVTLLK